MRSSLRRLLPQGGFQNIRGLQGFRLGGLALGLSLGLATTLIASAGCSGGNEVPTPTEYARILYSIDTPPGSGSANKFILLTGVPSSCERTQQQIRFIASGYGASVQFTLKGAATAAYQASLNTSPQTKDTAKVDLSLPLSYDMMGAGQNPVAFTTADSGYDLTCVLALNIPDPFADFSGDFMCQSGSNATIRKLTLNGSFKAAPCPKQ